MRPFAENVSRPCEVAGLVSTIVTDGVLCASAGRAPSPPSVSACLSPSAPASKEDDDGTPGGDVASAESWAHAPRRARTTEALRAAHSLVRRQARSSNIDGLVSAISRLRHENER